MITPNVTIDARNLNNGLKIAQEFTSKSMADACNYAAKEVAYAAFKETPVTTAARVDSDLGKIIVPVLNKNGTISKSKRNYKGGKMGTKAGNETVPLTVLIIQARARPGSHYNQITGGRYALTKSPFKGVSRAAGRAAMAALESSMIKGRRRAANGFIRAGWLPSIKVLRALTSRLNYGTTTIPENLNEGLGTVYPAKYNDKQASCTIESDVGFGSSAGLNHASNNEALMRVGTPALQKAIDGVGVKQFEYILKKLGRIDLEIPVNAAWNP